MLFVLLSGGSVILVLILAIALTIYTNKQNKKKTKHWILTHGKEKNKLQHGGRPD